MGWSRMGWDEVREEDGALLLTRLCLPKPGQVGVVVQGGVQDTHGDGDGDGQPVCLEQQFDGCASWWTQGPDLALQVMG